MYSILFLLLAAGPVLSCTPHNYHNRKRAEESGPADIPYDISDDWGSLTPDNSACRDGVTQSPIGLQTSQGFAQTHIPTFANFDQPRNGTFRNWGYGPAMDLAHPEGDLGGLPLMTFDEHGTNETVSMIGWHIHGPSDHVVDGVRTKAELHLVFAGSAGEARAVVGVRMHPGSKTSEFMTALPSPLIHVGDAATVQLEATINMAQVLGEVDHLSQFWTYTGEY